MAEIFSVTFHTLSTPVAVSVHHTHTETLSGQSDVLLLATAVVCFLVSLSLPLSLSLAHLFSFLGISYSFPISVFSPLNSFFRQIDEAMSLSLPLIFDESPLPTAGDNSKDLVKAFVWHSSAELGVFSTILDFVGTEYKAEVLNIDQPAQTARLIGPAQVEIVPSLLRVGRCVSKFSTFSVAEKNSPLSFVSKPLYRLTTNSPLRST